MRFKVELCLLLFLACLVGIHGFRFFTKDKKLSPVILVPGDGGSQLMARLNKSSQPHYICYKQSDWFPLWLNLEELLPGVVACWIDNIKLYYDNITRTTYNTPGVEIAIPGWGDPTVVEWIDINKNKAGAYFKDIGNLLVDLGYDRKTSLRGAPYDFRKAPNELGKFFTDLKDLVEDTYEVNDKMPITFISHSMGSAMTLVFLQQQSSEWKRKYIKRQISLAGAWAGSMKAIKVYAMGDDLDSVFLSSRILREEQITNPSTAWLLPSPLFWKGSEIIAETPKRVYKMYQLQDFLRDVDYLPAWEMRKDTMKYTLNFNAPDIELHCLYGDGVPTVEKLVYKRENINGETPTLVKGPGDGTVNRRSLRACRYWTGYQDPNITVKAFPNVNHMDILSDAGVLNYIKDLLKLD